VKSDVYRRTIVAMDTFVTIEIPGHDADDEVVEPAFEWFRQIESHCSRFDAQSELMQLVCRTGQSVPVSTILFEAVRFSLALAEETGGAYDPTIGHWMETHDFNRQYQTGAQVKTEIYGDGPVSFRDVLINPEQRTITLLRPLILDLAAIVKGLAVDLAARELQKFTNFMVDAGGDVYLGGHNSPGQPWTVGIPHPRRDTQLLTTILASDRAVCTSGDYERGRHIFDPRTGAAVTGVASVTVVAPTAMLADGLATAAFVLGPSDGLSLLDRMDVDGLIVTPDLEQFATRGFFH
jgi:thiamine biosynthesis lipoprotein